MARSASTTAHDPTEFFKVSEEDFDQIFGRIEEAGIPYGSGPRALEDMSINRRGGGRGAAGSIFAIPMIIFSSFLPSDRERM